MLSSSASVKDTDRPDQPSAIVRTPDLDRRDSSRLWSVGFVCLMATQFVVGMGFSTFNLLPKFLHMEMGASASEIGLAMGVALVAAVLGAPVAAIWLAGGARRRPARVSLLLLAATAVGFVFIRRFGLPLLALRAVQGGGFALLQSVVVIRVAETVPSARLGQAIGYVGLAGLVTNALAPLFAEPLARAAGWHVVFAVAAVLGLTALATISPIRDVAPGTPLRLGAARRVLNRHLAGVLYAAVICGVGCGTMITFTQPLALQRGARDVGAMFSGYALAAAGVRLLFGTVADRWGRRRVSIAALILYSVVVALAARLTPATLFVLGLGLGTAHGCLYPALNALAFEVSSPEARSLVATTFSGSFSLGYAFSVLALGPVADRWGYGALFAGGAVVTITGACVLAASSPKRPRSLESLDSERAPRAAA